LNFELDLIFEKARMAHHVMVEDVLIGEASEDQIETKDPDQCYDGKGDKLAGNVVTRPRGDGSEGGRVIRRREWGMWQEGDEVVMP
jgi:hypothetical protein